MSEIKKFLYVNRKAPYGTIYALEAGGEKAVFEKDLPRVIEAFGTLN